MGECGLSRVRHRFVSPRSERKLDLGLWIRVTGVTHHGGAEGNRLLKGHFMGTVKWVSSRISDIESHEKKAGNLFLVWKKVPNFSVFS